MFELQDWPPDWPVDPLQCEICDQWKGPAFWLRSPTETAVSWGNQSVFREPRPRVLCAGCIPKDMTAGQMLSQAEVQRLKRERR